MGERFCIKCGKRYNELNDAGGNCPFCGASGSYSRDTNNTPTVSQEQLQEIASGVNGCLPGLVDGLFSPIVSLIKSLLPEDDSEDDPTEEKLENIRVMLKKRKRETDDKK